MKISLSALPGSYSRLCGSFFAILMVGICLMGSGISSYAQALDHSGSGAGLPPVAPESHVLDEANLFYDHGEILTEVQESLNLIKNQYGYPVYLVIYYNAHDVSLQQRADRLYDAWIGESRNGMVIVYQLDPVVLGDNPVMSYRNDSGLDPEFSGGSTSIPSMEMDAILARVRAGTEGKSKEHIPLITSLVYGLEAEIGRYNQVKPVSWHDTENLSFMGVFLGLIIVCIILAAVLWKLLQPADAKSKRVYYFPEVKVGRRLGAPHGGGWVSEKKFVPASSRR